MYTRACQLLVSVLLTSCASAPSAYQGPKSIEEVALERGPSGIQAERLEDDLYFVTIDTTAWRGALGNRNSALEKRLSQRLAEACSAANYEWRHAYSMAEIATDETLSRYWQVLGGGTPIEGGGFSFNPFTGFSEKKTVRRLVRFSDEHEDGYRPCF